MSSVPRCLHHAISVKKEEATGHPCAQETLAPELFIQQPELHNFTLLFKVSSLFLDTKAFLFLICIQRPSPVT